MICLGHFLICFLVWDVPKLDSSPDGGNENQKKEKGKMIRATYKTMPSLIANRVPFTHGSAHAYTDTDGMYRVVSYSTEIATSLSPFNDGVFVNHLNERKYSMTTSRLQNIIRKAWAI
jgi:hypothetical protein